MTPPSFLKTWPIKRHEFGMFFFWMLGSCNDITIFERSPLFAKLGMGETVSVQFVANSRTYDKGYHLVDGICLK
jgi:hypothetical protein